jgi:hypothetical protein
VEAIKAEATGINHTNLSSSTNNRLLGATVLKKVIKSHDMSEKMTTLIPAIRTTLLARLWELASTTACSSPAGDNAAMIDDMETKTAKAPIDSMLYNLVIIGVMMIGIIWATVLPLSKTRT